MALSWLPYVESRYAPACCQDYIEGKRLFQRLAHGTPDECLVEIVPLSASPYHTIAGEVYFLTWHWRDCALQTCQGYLHVRKFQNEREYKNMTNCCCRLFVLRDDFVFNLSQLCIESKAKEEASTTKDTN